MSGDKFSSTTDFKKEYSPVHYVRFVVWAWDTTHACREITVKMNIIVVVCTPCVYTIPKKYQNMSFVKVDSCWGNGRGDRMAKKPLISNPNIKRGVIFQRNNNLKWHQVVYKPHYLLQVKVEMRWLFLLPGKDLRSAQVSASTCGLII